MAAQTRRRLPNAEESGPIARQVKEANKFLSKHPLPKLLDRKRWTKKRWRRHEEAWSELDRERKQEQRNRDAIRREMRTRAKRGRHHKVLRGLRKSIRRERMDQRQDRKIQRSITEHHHSDLILAALKSGVTTVGQVCKKTGLETRDARRCLKSLVQKGDVEKPSSRQYQITKPKQRRHLVDVQPTKRRKRLVKKSKAR